MSSPSDRAIVVNGTSRLGRVAIAAMVDAGREVLATGPGSAGFDTANVHWLDADCSGEGGWAAINAALGDRAGKVDTLLVAPPTDEPSDDLYPAMATAWLGARFALPLFRPQGAGILLSLAFTALSNGAQPAQDGTCEAIRLLTQSALHDASVSGISLRSNRLFCAADADPSSVRETICFLTDARSAFMSGTEITLLAANLPRPAAVDLTGKAFLVTGATSGIGRATAIEIARRGGWVAVGGRKLDLAEETLALVRAAGGDGCVIALDVTDAGAWQAAAERIGELRGEIHGLVNNAGEARNRQIEQLSESDLAFLSAVNCRAVRLGMDAMVPLLDKGRGVILNISSVAGIRAGPGGSAYGATKAAMIGLSRGYAAAFAASGKGVRVNSIQPGLIWSESVADSLGDEGARQARALLEPKTPLGRVGKPEEVGMAIAFLLSDAAAPINAQAINVSGGLELGWP